jgi:hypothetical protein
VTVSFIRQNVQKIILEEKNSEVCILLIVMPVEKMETFEWKLAQKVPVSKFSHAILSWHNRYAVDNLYQPIYISLQPQRLQRSLFEFI